MLGGTRTIQHIRNLPGLRPAILIAVLAFAFAAGMRQHWNYPYPLHVDEWFGIGYANETFHARSLTFLSPYQPIHFDHHPELGFHALWAFLEVATGMPWEPLYRFAPGVQMALLSLLMYALGRRQGYGIWAAILVPLIPSSLWTLGPDFVVPVIVAILLVPVCALALDVAQNDGQGGSRALLLVLIIGTLFIHATTAVLLVALVVLNLGLASITALQEQRRRDAVRLAVSCVACVVLPLLVLVVWHLTTGSGILSHAGTRAEQVPYLMAGFVSAYGRLAVLVALAGAALYFGRREHGLRTAILPLLTVGLLGFLSVYPGTLFGPRVLYERGWMYLGVFLVLLTGYGLSSYMHYVPVLAEQLRRRVFGREHLAVEWVLYSAGVVVAVVLALTPLLRQQGSDYYHLVGPSNIADYEWLSGHLPTGALLTMGEPSMAWAYQPFAGAGSRVFRADVFPRPNEDTTRIRKMAFEGTLEVEWLRSNGVIVFYTCFQERVACSEVKGDTTDLFKVREGVYYIPPGTLSTAKGSESAQGSRQ